MQLVLLDENVGEFMIEIVGNATDPLPLEQVKWTSEDKRMLFLLGSSFRYQLRQVDREGKMGNRSKGRKLAIIVLNTLRSLFVLCLLYFSLSLFLFTK